MRARARRRRRAPRESRSLPSSPAPPPRQVAKRAHFAGRPAAPAAAAAQDDAVATGLLTALKGAERTASVARVLARVDGALGPARADALCFRAVLLVLTRAFDLSHLVDDAEVALWPFADLFNHPSAAAVRGSAFADVGVSGAAVRSSLEDGRLCLRAPSELAVAAGDEIFNWYGNAGFGAESPDAWKEAELRFTYQYGFSPWG